MVESTNVTFDNRRIPRIDNNMKELLKFKDENILEDPEENEDSDEIMQVEETVQQKNMENSQIFRRSNFLCDLC